jgi:senataxin
MALTTEQQTSHLSRLQQEVLAWDYYRLLSGPRARGGASRRGGRALRDVPRTFASVHEYLDVFEPLVLEECAAQIARGDEEEPRRSDIGAVFRTDRVDGFHVVRFILGEDAMARFHDNDLILVSKEPFSDEAETRALRAAAAEEDGREYEDADEETAGDRSESNPKPPNSPSRPFAREDRTHALGYVDGRDSRNAMRVRFFLPEPRAALAASADARRRKKAAAAGGGGGGPPEEEPNVTTKRTNRRGAAAAAQKAAAQKATTDALEAAEDGSTPGGGGAGAPEEARDLARFRSVRNALASPGGAWYLTHLANMSTIAREWLALHAFPGLPFAHAILSGKPAVAGRARSSWELPAPLEKSMAAAYNGANFFLRVFPGPARRPASRFPNAPLRAGFGTVPLSLFSRFRAAL